MMSLDHQPAETLKLISGCQNQEQLLEIGEGSILTCLREYFPVLIGEKKTLDLKDAAIFFALKKLIDGYQGFANVLFSNPKNEQPPIIGAQFKQKTEGVDFQSRKNTRATLAMRNSKNQQQLKKDQIFVRLIPRTHNCIHFMVKNHNFPRIECRLSCNQHLEYLLTYLTNKWLRGKVGVGYQIKLYPDPSTYMQKHSHEGKRPNIIHEPLNNYLMFTDIMAAFGVAQNGCINLLYDITELRKEKEKYSKIMEKDNEYSSENYNVKVQKPESSALEQFKQFTASPHKKFGKPTRNQLKAQEKVQNNLRPEMEPLEEMSIGLGQGASKQKKGYLGNNSIDYSDANSLGYQFNAFNSNQILGTLFNMNNSNTFLNLCSENNKNHHENPIAMTTPTKNQSKSSFKLNPIIKNSPPSNSAVNQTANPAIGTANNPVPESKLENIRNFINIIEKEVGPIHSEPVPQLIEKQQNSIQKSESNVFKKQVKTVTIIKKKNQPE